MRETLTNNAVYMDDVMGGYTIEGNTFIDVVCNVSSYHKCGCLPSCLPKHSFSWCACVRVRISSRWLMLGLLLRWIGCRGGDRWRVASPCNQQHV
eukprot:COSAG02_NODE_3805_length_6204_cov_1.605569_5_plen_95_part_00